MADFELNHYTESNFLNYKGKMVFKSKNKTQQAIYDNFMNIFDTNKNGFLEGNEIKNLWSEIKAIDGCKDNKLDNIEATYFVHSKELTNCGIQGSDLISFLNSINKTIESKKAKQESKIKNITKREKIIEEYSYENLRKKYSGSEYSISQDVSENGKHIGVISSKDGLVISIDYYKNGNTQIYNILENEQKTYDKYDNVIQIVKYIDGVGHVTFDKVQNEINAIVKTINDDISERKWHIIPTTGKDLEKHIKQITSQNIVNIMKTYEKNNGKSLSSAIQSEWGLDKNVKKRILDYLNQCLVKSDYWKKNKPNCKIDAEFRQGDIGDCWFLAALAACAVKPKGLEILNNTIKENPDGSYTVKFKGTDESYNVTPIDLLDFKGASGDQDVQLLEIAANRHFLTGIKYGGTGAEALDLLCGTNNKWLNIINKYNPFDHNTDKSLREIIKDPDTFVTTGINIFTRIGMKTKGKDYKDEIAFQHAYAIVDMDDNYVYLKNPWNSKKPTNKDKENSFKIPLSDFKWHFTGVEFVKLD